MKKLNLTLAVLLALGLTACGSSSSDGGKSNDVVDNNKHQDDKKDKLPVVPSNEVVDPTNEGIVAQFDLEKQSSTGSNLYIRGSKSSFQKKTNPEYNSQSSVTYHNKLEADLQNIFVVQSTTKNADGKKEAYYVGRVYDTASGNGEGQGRLQEVNITEIEAVGGYYYADAKGYHNDVRAKIGTASGVVAAEFSDLEAYLDAYNTVLEKKEAVDVATPATIEAYNAALQALLGESAKIANSEKVAKTVDISTSKSEKFKYLTVEGKETKDLSKTDVGGGTPATAPVANVLTLSPESYSDFALKEQVHFTSLKNHLWPNDLYNLATRDVGLVAIYTDGPGKDTVVKGREEDEKRIQRTRIFGHKYLNTAGSHEFNSYMGAELNEAKDDILVAKQKLDYVQYGRVTADTEVEGQVAGSSPRYVYKVLDYANKSAKKDTNAVDFYFARGEGATEVSAMPKEGKLSYVGHAVTWGFAHMPAGEDHGAPNSVGSSAVVDGVGSFVKATLDASTKTFSGSIYDSYAFKKDGKYGDLKKHELINFKDAKVKGNTAFGEATATGYEDKGELRASFFGPSAQEVAGVVNSVTAKDKRANAKWGAVFGAKRYSKTPKPDVSWGSDDD